MVIEGNLVNPESVVAGEIVHAVSYTAAAEVAEFAGGRVVFLGYPIGSNSPLIGSNSSDHSVSSGDSVTMGTALGRSGNTGFSTAPHLHFEVRLGAAATSAINPEPFFVTEIPSKDLLFTVKVSPDGDGVRLRIGPGTNFKPIANLHTDDQLEVFGLAGNNVWLRVKDGFVMYDPKWYAIQKPDDNG